MISGKIIWMIESHAEQLNNGLVKLLKSDAKTARYKDIPDDEVYRRTYDVCKNLGLWLGETSDERIGTRYQDVGRVRREEGMPLSQVVAALTLTRDHLWKYVKNEGLFETALELHQEMEFVALVLKFFDKAIYYTTVGYEEADA